MNIQEFQNWHSCFLKKQQKTPPHVLYTMLMPSIASAEIFISFIAVQVWGWGAMLEQHL